MLIFRTFVLATGLMLTFFALPALAGQPAPDHGSPMGPNTPITQFPGDSYFPGDAYTPQRVQMLQEAGISTIGDLANADPRQVGRILDISPREVQQVQRQIQQPPGTGQRPAPTQDRDFGAQAPQQRERARRPGQAQVDPGTPLNRFPGDSYFPGDAYTPRRIQMLNDAGIMTVADLANADPRQVGRILDLNPRQIQEVQRQLPGGGGQADPRRERPRP